MRECGTQKIKKMTFKCYINSKSAFTYSDKTLAIKNIADACKVSIPTVYRWLNGKCLPDPLKIQRISELTNIPVEDLFPENQQQTADV